MSVKWINLKIHYKFHIHKILITMFVPCKVTNADSFHLKHILIASRKQYYRMIRNWTRKQLPIMATFKANLITIHVFLTSLLKYLYNFTHLHLYMSIPFCFFFFIFIFYNRTAYRKYSTLLPNLHIYSASPHCTALKSGLQKFDSCVIHAPPLCARAGVSSALYTELELSIHVLWTLLTSLFPFTAELPSSVVYLAFFSPSSLFPLHAGSCHLHRPSIPQIALIKSTMTLMMLNQMVIFRSHLT